MITILSKAHQRYEEVSQHFRVGKKQSTLSGGVETINTFGWGRKGSRKRKRKGRKGSTASRQIIKDPERD